MLLTHRPTPALVPYVELLWHDDGYRAANHRERVLPGAAFVMIFELESGLGVVNGLRSQYIELDTNLIQTVMGVLFRPGGARAFFDGSAEQFFNQMVPLDLAWGSAGTNLRDRLRETVSPCARFEVLENALLARRRPQCVLHPAVDYGLREFQHAPNIRSVLAVTKNAGLSRRRFSQLFREQVGITPKLYCRLHRFRWVLEQVASGKAIHWAALAAASGYSDQAHLTHEFREFSGLTPGAFLMTERPSCGHVRVS